jgi:hypothetical protein
LFWRRNLEPARLPREHGLDAELFDAKHNFEDSGGERDRLAKAWSESLGVAFAAFSSRPWARLLPGFFVFRR